MNKQDFPLLENSKLVYLDNSATTQKPRQVIEAISNFYMNSNANVHRGIHLLSEKSTMMYEKAHKVVAEFINSKESEIVFTSGTTQSLNMIAFSLARNLEPGDEILLTEMEHHSNMVPWQQIAKEKNCLLKYIPVKNSKLDMQKAAEMITAKTKVVSVVHMSNVLGTINPVKELARLTHKVGAYIVVDAAQSVPHFPVDVEDLDCDFLAFSGHKMGGPTGIGVLYGKEELLNKFDPVVFGGGMINEVSFERSTWGELPYKFEAGTPNIAGAVGLMAAVEYLHEIGMDKIASHQNELTKYALEKMSNLPGLSIVGVEDGQRGGVISFTIEGLHPHDISESLDKQNIAVRAGHHCCMPLMKKLGLSGTTRISFYIYNTKEDVDYTVWALQEILGLRMLSGNEEVDYFDQKGGLSEDQEIYMENIIDHYKNPQNKSILKPHTHSHTEHNPLCGDHISVYAEIKDDIIQQISFTGDGCAISQASISILLKEVKGKSVDEVKKISETKIFDMLGIPISYSRMKCALLSLKTIQGALC